MNTQIDFGAPQYYKNRELSWILFDRRVLSEAKDKNIPLMERLKFLSITASNLDEFFMIRVASLKDMVHAGYKKKDIAGLTAKEQLSELNVETHQLVDDMYKTYNKLLVPELKANGLVLVSCYEELNEKEEKWVDKYFMDNVYPVLTPMAVDSSRPFPLIRNKSLNIGALVKKKDGDEEISKRIYTDIKQVDIFIYKSISNIWYLTRIRIPYTTIRNIIFFINYINLYIRYIITINSHFII